MNDNTLKALPTKIRLPSEGSVRISTVLNLPEPFNVDAHHEPLTLRPIAPFVGDTTFKPAHVELVKHVNGDVDRLLSVHHLDYYYRNKHDLPQEWEKRTHAGETRIIVFSATPLQVEEHDETMFAYLSFTNPIMGPRRMHPKWVAGLILAELVSHSQNHIFHALRKP